MVRPSDDFVLRDAHFGDAMNEALVKELNASWQQSEGDYNAFEKEMRAAIAKAFNVPAHLLERQVSYNRILTGEFTVIEGRHKRPLIVECVGGYGQEYPRQTH